MMFFAAAAAYAQSPPATFQPRLVSRTEPSYSEEARRAGVSATVALSFIVNGEGVPEDIRVTQSAGFGLDEKAIEAVSTWRFEPPNGQGSPATARTPTEISFHLLVPNHEGQFARLEFTLPSGCNRPELIQGRMPANPDDRGDAKLRVALTVGADGTLQNFSILETSSPQWADDAVREIRNWRFLTRCPSGEPSEAKGIFELTRVSTKTVSVSPSELTDPSLAAPNLISPPDGAVFDVYPRRTTVQWESSPGAVAYILEWDYSYKGIWRAEAQNLPGSAFLVQATQFSFDFVGAQPGRWRVWPVNAAGQRGTPSRWWTFRYLR